MRLGSTMRGLPRLYWCLWTGVLINRAGGFVVPFLTLYLTQLRRVPVQTVGVIVTLYGLGAALASVLGGALADAIGRRATMLFGLAAGGAVMMLFAFVEDPAWLGLTAFLLSLSGDLYRPSVSAAIADVVPERDRSRAFSVLFWGINLGFAIGTSLAGVLARADYRLLFFGDALTTFTFMLVIWRFVPETRAPGRDAHPSIKRLLAPAKDRRLLEFLLPMFAIGLVFQQSLVTLPLDMVRRGLSPTTFGVLLGLNGVVIGLVQPPAAAALSPLRASLVLPAACALLALGFGLHAVTTSAAGYAGAILIWTLGEIGSAPIGGAVVAELAPPDLRGSYQGAFQLTFSLAALVAPILGAAVYDWSGGQGLWGGAALLCVLAGVQHWAAARRRERPRAEPHRQRS